MPTLIALTLADAPRPGGRCRPVSPTPPSGWRSSRSAIAASASTTARCKRQVDAAREDYLRIPNDDLLKGFRRRAGKPAPGADLGGWYSSDIFHVFGQILSGLARLHAATGDPACREKAEALLAGWAECIEPDGYFYYSRKPNAPHYIYDKMVGGLTDMVLFCDSKLAAESLAKITGWAVEEPRPVERLCLRRHRVVHAEREPLPRPPRDRRPALSRLRRGLALRRILGHLRAARATSSATAATAGGPASITPTATSTPSAARPRRISTPAIAGSSTRSVHAHDMLRGPAVLSHRRVRARRAAPAPRRLDQEGRLLAQLVRDPVRLLRGVQALQVPA